MDKNKSEEINIKTIAWKSPEYQQELLLRNDVLRKPLGLNLFDQDLESEENYLRTGAFIGQTLIGVLLMVPFEDQKVQMKQMAVADQYQKQQVGRKIIEFSEQLLKEHGFRHIFMHAREYAVPFYQKLGYHISGERFTEVGIAHFKMQKEL